MAKQTVNLGTMADNKSGDPLRTAFEKINENFDELYANTHNNSSLVKQGASLEELGDFYSAYESLLYQFLDIMAQLEGQEGYPFGVQLPITNPEAAYVALMQYGPNEIPGFISLVATAGSLRNAFTGFQEAVVSAEITSGEVTLRFNNLGELVFPDGTKQKTAYQGTLPELYVPTQSGTTVLDVTKQIHKLTPVDSSGGSVYHLPNGVEGQIIYIVPAAGGEQSNELTSMSFDNARWTNGNGIINSNEGVTWWLPFRGYQGTSAVLTLIFTDGAWNLPHNYFD
jgi:hypothetical protein